MKKVIGLCLCIICVVTFSAFDWGMKPKPKAETPGTQQTGNVTPAASAPVVPAVSQMNAGDTYGTNPTVPAVTNSNVQKKTQNARKKKTSQKQMTPAANKSAPAADVAAPTGPASDKAIAIVTLAKIVGSGTPEERKARIESLKRLSQALAKSQGQQT